MERMVGKEMYQNVHEMLEDTFREKGITDKVGVGGEMLIGRAVSMEAVYLVKREIKAKKIQRAMWGGDIEEYVSPWREFMVSVAKGERLHWGTRESMNDIKPEMEKFVQHVWYRTVVYDHEIPIVFVECADERAWGVLAAMTLPQDIAGALERVVWSNGWQIDNTYGLIHQHRFEKGYCPIGRDCPYIEDAYTFEEFMRKIGLDYKSTRSLDYGYVLEMARDRLGLSDRVDMRAVV